MRRTPSASRMASSSRENGNGGGGANGSGSGGVGNGGNGNVQTSASATNLSSKRQTSTAKLTEYASLRDLSLTPPARIPREASPSTFAQPRNHRSTPGRTSRESSPAPVGPSAGRQNSVTTSPSQSNLNVHKIDSAIQPISPQPQRPFPQWPMNHRLSSTRSPPPQPHPQRLQSPITASRRRVDSSSSQLPPIVLHPENESGKRTSPSEEQTAAEEVSTIFNTGIRTPRHCASPAPVLETVAEGSIPSTPALSLSRKLQPLEEAQQSSEVLSSQASSRANESESDSGNKSDEKPPSRAPSRLARRPTLGNTKIPQGDATQNMTAEIETVVSVPKPVNPETTRKLTKKQSSDTIRPPKKEKKKKRAAPVAPANQAKKADFFEQKMNDALQDVDSSDSEETFVYESNPPEPPSRPRHSRTPSTTSLHSDIRRPMVETAQNLSSKRSWKFGPGTHGNRDAGAYSEGYNTEGSATFSGPDRQQGSASSHQASMRSHTGRTQHHQSIFPEDGGPFQNINNSHHKPSHTSLRHHVTSSRASSRPPSPRGNSMRHPSTGNGAHHYPGPKRGGSKLSLYEADIETEGGTERTPLIPYGAPRAYGTRHGKRRYSPDGAWRDLERGRDSWAARMAACLIAALVVLLVIAGALGFLFVTSKPLEDLKVSNITDVLVSKQDLMFNMVVDAVNPNALTINIVKMDVNIFAKSPYVKDKKPDDGDGDGDGDGDNDDGGDDDPWWFIGGGGKKKKPASKNSISTSRRRKAPRAKHEKSSELYLGTFTHFVKAKAGGGVDEGVGTDPDNDLEGDSQTMLLGRIFTFDSPLTFEGSPFRNKKIQSIGAVQLAKPGNKTEEGGSERWERVMVHKFELIVRGVLRYSLPLSGRIRSAPISASVIVQVDEPPSDNPVGETDPVIIGSH